MNIYDLRDRLTNIIVSLTAAINNTNKHSLINVAQKSFEIGRVCGILETLEKSRYVEIIRKIPNIELLWGKHLNIDIDTINNIIQGIADYKRYINDTILNETKNNKRKFI